MNVFYGSKYVTTTITCIWSYLNGKRTEFGHSCRHNVDGVARNPIKLSRIITNYYTITCKILLSKFHIYPGYYRSVNMIFRFMSQICWSFCSSIF